MQQLPIYTSLHKELQSSLTEDPVLANSVEYRVLLSVINQMHHSGLLRYARGNCVAVSGMLVHLLQQVDIPARIVECRATSTQIVRGEMQKISYLGYDGPVEAQSTGFLDTHAVVVTEGMKPILIDLAAHSILPQGRVFLAESLNSLDPDIMLLTNIESSKIVYNIKKNPRLVGMRQNNLLAQLKEDYQNQRIQRWLVWSVVGLVVFSMLNFALNVAILAFGG